MNDDFNHYIDVQTALKQVCEFDQKTAEAHTIITHMVGASAIVENVEYENAKLLQEKLENLGINTQITDVDSEPL